MFVCDVKCPWLSMGKFKLGLTVQSKKDCTLARYLPRKTSHSSVSHGFSFSLVLWEILDQHQHTHEKVWRMCGGSLSPVPVFAFHTSHSNNYSVWHSRQWGRTCCCWLLLQFATQLFTAVLCITGSPLSLVHQYDICCCSSPLPSSPTAPLSNPLLLSTDKYQHPKSFLPPPTGLSTCKLYCF